MLVFRECNRWSLISFNRAGLHTSTPRLFSKAFVAVLSAGAIAGIAAASGTGMKILLLLLMEEILHQMGFIKSCK